MSEKKNDPILGIVVPCYNEEEVLPETTKRLTAVIQDLIQRNLISKDSYILYVDDGSKDKTWELIQLLFSDNPFVSGLKLAQNAGHQKALLAGLMKAKETADCVISIDADLQDDLDVIAEFIDRFHKGYDVVYGVRNDRTSDTFFKRTTAQGYYKIMRLMGVNLVYNHADYRLMSKNVLNKLSTFKEYNLFLRGIIPLIGFKSTQVYYERHERFAGESKYPLRKMLAFAFDGITSFSVTPIRFVTYVGLSFSIISLLVGGYALVSKFFGATISGWTSLILSVWFIGGIQLMSIGLIGEYIGRIYKETKQRPKYIVEEHLVNAGHRSKKQSSL
jgi:polyisoprenyl-phosphate glycosyltransferase